MFDLLSKICMCNKLALAIYLILECKTSANFCYHKVWKRRRMLIEIAILNYYRYQSTFTTPSHIFHSATTTCFTDMKNSAINEIGRYKSLPEFFEEGDEFPVSKITFCMKWWMVIGWGPTMKWNIFGIYVFQSWWAKIISL